MKESQTTEAPLPGAQVWPLSVPAYHVLGEAGLIPKRTELLYGYVYHKMPKSPFHSYLVSLILRLVRPVLPSGVIVRSEQPITCADSEPEPDVSIVRGNEEDYRHEHPHTAEFVVEICVTSYEYDRSKLRAYAGAGVKECWLVLGPEKQIEVHRKPMGDRFAERVVYGPGGKVASSVLPEVVLDLDALFVE